MKDNNAFERSITRDLREVIGKKKFKWVEWGCSEEAIKKNLVTGEKAIHLPLTGVWVAYVGV